MAAITNPLQAKPDRPPNVILIFTDDQGTLDLNCYGSKDLFTPNLDALAERGVRFTQFYVASPVCSPSRAALLTGRNPLRAGVKTNVSSRPGAPGMPASEITLAELLKTKGYRTALFGKWHLGDTPESAPNGQGFDEFFGHKSGCIDNYSHYFYWQGPPFHDLWRNEIEVFEDGVHFTELIVRETNRFIAANKEKPRFIYLARTLPHYPTQAPEQFRKIYEKMPEPRRSYAATISYLDDAVGRVASTVDRLGLRENTMIIFLSDHGHSTEERTGFGGGNAGEFRGAKFSLFEGGIRVPCIASWPGKIPEGQTRGQFAASVDWFPTIGELCGVTLPERTFDGKNLAGVLRSADAPSPHGVFHWQIGDQWAVRDGVWKLLNNASDSFPPGKTRVDKVFLANLAKDPTESKNFAAEESAIVHRLTALHNQWLAELAK